MPDAEPTRQDATVFARPLEVNLLDGLEGDRSKCCLAPAAVDYGEEGTNCYVCSACKKPCDLLASEDKVAINTKAKAAVEEIMGTRVRVVVIHKPSNKSTSASVLLSDVRKYAEAAAASFPGKPSLSEFVVVEYSSRGVSVSSLE